MSIVLAVIYVIVALFRYDVASRMNRLASENSNSLSTQSLRDTLNSEYRAGIGQSIFKISPVPPSKNKTGM